MYSVRMPSEAIVRARQSVRAYTERVPKVGLVLGSGLGDFADVVRNAVHIPFTHVEGMRAAHVAGHAGLFVLGELGSAADPTPVIVMQGRLHLYEGHAPHDVVFGVRLMRALGAETLILTNAAGGLDPAIAEGELMCVSDHLNLTGSNPLVGPNDPALGPRFPDMSEIYDRQLRELCLSVGHELGIRVHEGIYAGVLGPSYETPAEVRMLRSMGATAVGMSTVLEAIAARHV